VLVVLSSLLWKEKLFVKPVPKSPDKVGLVAEKSMPLSAFAVSNLKKFLSIQIAMLVKNSND